MSTTRNTTEEFKILLENSPLGIVMTNMANEFIYTNPSFQNMLGYTDEELRSKKINEVTHPDSIQKSIRAINKAFDGHGTQTLRKNYIHKNGSAIHAITRISVVFDLNGKPIYQCTNIENIEDRIATKKQLISTKKRAETIIETAMDAIIEFDSEGKICTCNQMAENIFGQSKSQLLSNSISSLIFRHDRNSDFFQWLKSRENRYQLDDNDQEFFGWHNCGKHFPLYVSVTSYFDNEKLYYSLFARDITERKKIEKQQQYFATHDDLTGLPNRLLLTEILQQVIDSSIRTNREHALFFLDLDNFKKINDSLGHHCGDLLLKEVSGRLKHSVRKEDFVARMGGDEFAILIQDNKSPEDVDKVGKSIVDIFSEPFKIHNNVIHVSPSIGIANYPRHGKNIENLLKNADLAMYKAKNSGRNNYQVFNKSLSNENNHRLEMESKLWEAISRDQLVMHYQPKFCLKKKILVGMEALVRWPTTHNQYVMPDEFIPIAEETGLIIPLGKYIIEKVCRETKGFYDSDLADGRVSINVSTLQFNQVSFLHELKEILEKTQFNPEKLELEITESAIIHDFEKSTLVIDKLHDLGIHVSMDDFGMGYSSLSYLQKLPVDVLKIDKSFIDNIATSTQSRKMVEFIIQLAHHLSLSVVAEGIEHQKQVGILTKLHCDKAQGYYFSRPIPFNELMNLS